MSLWGVILNSWQLAQKRTLGNSQLITAGPKENCSSQLLAPRAGTVIPNFWAVYVHTLRSLNAFCRVLITSNQSRCIKVVNACNRKQGKARHGTSLHATHPASLSFVPLQHSAAKIIQRPNITLTLRPFDHSGLSIFQASNGQQQLPRRLESLRTIEEDHNCMSSIWCFWCRILS